MAIPGSLQFTSSPPAYKDAPVVAGALKAAVASATGAMKTTTSIPSGEGTAKTTYGGIQTVPSSGTPMPALGSPTNEVSIDNTATAKYLTLAVIVIAAYFILR